MPAGFNGAETADGFPIFDHVRNNIDFRMVLHKATTRFLNRRNVEFTKTPAELNQIFVGQLLPLKHQHLVIKPEAINGFKLTGDHSSKIDAANHGPERFSS